MALQQMLRMLRLSLVRLPAVGYGAVPGMPVHPYRDLWKGNSIYGIHLIKGELIHQDQVIPLQPGLWGRKGASVDILSKMYDFSWLRHMRELGTDNARLSARSLVADWIGRDINTLDPIACRPHIVGSRLIHWLGNYDFFAASADDAFRQQFMQRFMLEGRYLVAMLPPLYKDHRVFSILKGVMCLSLCLPEQFDMIRKVNKHLQNALTQQILDDGMHIERNPEIQLFVLRDLVELKSMYQLINVRLPNELSSALDNVSRALRALRHADGGLALFNGANANDPLFIDYVLLNATQKRIAMTKMEQGGYIRCYTNRATLIVDTGLPATTGLGTKCASALAFEFSAGKQRIIVNCGMGGNATWKTLLGSTSAYSVLQLENTDSVTFKNNQSENPYFQVTSQYKKIDGSHLLELSHNGWLKQWGTMYYRTLYLAKGGEDLRGEDRIEAKGPVSFIIRFHLHPSIKIEEEVIEKQGKSETTYILTANSKLEGRQIWLFMFDGAQARIEESVYLGDGTRVTSRQIVLYGVLSPFSLDDREEEQKQAQIHHIETDGTEVTETVVEQQEGNSDYVAIFHNQDNHHTVSETDIEKASQENWPEMSQEKNEIKENKITEQDIQKLSESYQSPQPVQHIIRWALHRKL